MERAFNEMMFRRRRLSGVFEFLMPTLCRDATSHLRHHHRSERCRGVRIASLPRFLRYIKFFACEKHSGCLKNFQGHMSWTPFYLSERFVLSGCGLEVRNSRLVSLSSHKRKADTLRSIRRSKQAR